MKLVMTVVLAKKLEDGQVRHMSGTINMVADPTMEALLRDGNVIIAASTPVAVDLALEAAALAARDREAKKPG